MFTVPKTFKLIGMDYIVGELPEDQREDLHGLHLPSDSTISLDPQLPPQKLRAVFCHEWIHAALEAVGREDLSEDETLVDSLGSVLYQFLKTKRGRFPA